MTDDMDKTIPPQRAGANMPDMDKTMPGHHDRKTDGRFAVGDLIMGRYKVLAELGQGGMGVVYKCFDETAGIEVALKALPPELSHNSLEMDDIKDNFQLVHNLHHPNIASSNTLEKNPENGNYYLIMECCEGEDLRRWIKRKHRDCSMTWEEFLSVIRQVANALDYAHAQKIIHRDIKPGNIMIMAAGTVKVLDFGLAAQIHTSMTRVSMAYRGTSGTGPYMAPEQWRGRPQGAASDQYALAVMAYEMLAGSLPFASSDPAVLQQAVLTQQADPIEGLPEHAQNALDRALSKDPAARFNSCADFAAALGGESVAAPQRVEADTPDPANANDPEQEDPLLTRASLFWESGDFRSAKEYCERVLDRDPKNGEAYFIRLLAELKLKKQDDLLNASKLDRNQTFLLALKFAGPERKQELETLLQKWKDKAREKARARATILKRIGVITGICVLICLLAGGFFAYEVWQDHKAVEALKKAAAEQNLELSYNGETVTGVTDETVTSVVIPDGVMRIRGGAFEGCENLTSITIPDSVTSIGDGAFRGCSKLTSVTIGNGVTSIGNRAFWDCTALRSITIPDSVTDIGFRAFYGVKLKFIKVLTGNPVYSVDERSVLINKKEKKLLYAPCSLSGSYTVPSSVTSIGDRAFEGCENLTSITIPDSVTSIGDEAFRGCFKLTSVTIGNGVTRIGNRAFQSCTALRSITIPDSVTSIGDEAFRGCFKLTSIVVPTHFWSVDVPSSCKIYHSVEEKAQAEAAARVRAEAKARAEAAAEARAKAAEEARAKARAKAKTRTKAEVEALKKAAAEQNLELSNDGETVTGVTYSYIRSVVIPDGITSIGKDAFFNSKLLTSVTIPDSVMSIGKNAFSGCFSLTNVTIGNGVTSIGDYAFWDCTKLTSVTIPGSVMSIGKSAFSKCSSLTNVTIGNGVTSIGASAFYGCSDLESVTIPDSVTSIGLGAFSGCSSLTNITIPGHFWNENKYFTFEMEWGLPANCKVIRR